MTSEFELWKIISIFVLITLSIVLCVAYSRLMRSFQQLQKELEELCKHIDVSH